MVGDERCTSVGAWKANYLYDRVVSMRRLLGSMIQYLGGGAPQPFKINAPHGVYGVLRRSVNEDLVLWLLANVGFKDSAVGRMRQEFVPVENVEVSLHVPEGRKVKGIHLRRAGQILPHRLEGEYVVATLPSLHIAEILHLELE